MRSGDDTASVPRGAVETSAPSFSPAHQKVLDDLQNERHRLKTQVRRLRSALDILTEVYGDEVMAASVPAGTEGPSTLLSSYIAATLTEMEQQAEACGDAVHRLAMLWHRA